MPSQDISLFPRYSQSENRTTNYTLLICRLLYEESPALYSAFLESLLPGTGVMALPSFRQQGKVKGSVLDGVISQTAYTIFVETKRQDDFNEPQMRSHLAALASRPGDVRVLLALSSFANGNEAEVAARFQEVADELSNSSSARGSAPQVIAVSFETFLAAMPTFGAETAFARLIAEYRDYLDGEGLLPSWRTQLDIVPVGHFPEHVTQLKIYSCPSTGGAYHHRRCAYFGSYANKRVTHVAAIRGLVALSTGGDASLHWRNDTEATNAELISAARQGAQEAWGSINQDLLVFLLAEPHATDFRKNSFGGLRSRSYLDLSRLQPMPNSSAELAARLMGMHWSDLTSE